MIRCLSALAVLLLLPAAADAQLLGAASSAARGDDSSSSYSSNDDDDDDDYDSSWSSNDDYDDDYDEGGSLLGRASSSARGSGWSSGGSSAGSSGGGSSSDPTPYRRGYDGPGRWVALGGCPYEGGSSGYGRETTPGDRGEVGARLTLEGGFAVEGAGRIGASARAQLPWMLDLTARYSLFLEPVEGGDVVGLVLGRIGAEVRLVQIPAIQVRIGAGVRHMQDGLGAVPGFDASLGIDLFFGDPVIMSVDVTGGFVGEAGILGARVTLGAIVDSTEMFIGYDYQGLFASQHVNLGGPMAGVRLWL